MAGPKAKQIADDDDDVAMALHEAILATKSGPESVAWLKDFLNTISRSENAASRVDDWQIWKALLVLESNRTKDVDEWKRQAIEQSGYFSQANKHRNSAEAKSIAQTYCVSDKFSRGPRLAEFELQCSSLLGDNEKRKQAFLSHFERYSSAEFIVDDLQRNLGLIDAAAFASVRATIVQNVKPNELETIGEKVGSHFRQMSHNYN